MSLGLGMKGALIEYGSDFLGPLPNVVLFQFNPEQLSRTLQIPPRPTGAGARENTQAGDLPVESFNLTIHLTADDALMPGFVKTVGILPPLAALEKMVHPKGPLFGPNLAIDSVGAGLTPPDLDPTQLVPREKFPRLLFIWGPTRLLPVVITSMTITEQQYDVMLNPIRAEVVLGLSVIIPDACTDDMIARGASRYTEGAKEVMAVLNLGVTIAQVADMVHF